MVLCDFLKLRPSVNLAIAYGGALRVGRLFSCYCRVVANLRKSRIETLFFVCMALLTRRRK